MPPTEEELKSALKAFKKRFKATALDEQSRLGHGPLSSGSSTNVVSIQPPRGFSTEVWDALVQRGSLKADGVGFYGLVPGK